MKTYNVGDTVELIEKYDQYPAGTKATVTKRSKPEDGYTEWEDAQGHKYGCFARRLKLVVTEPFKVGDKVITTAADEEWTYKAGVEGTVTHIDTDEPKICVSGLGYVHTWDLKLAPVDAPETKFKVGDKVVVQANPEWAKEGQTGVIVQIDVYHGSSLPYNVKWDDGSWALYMREQDLELVKEFTFADILKGDTIRAEYTLNDVKYITEGVADRRSGGYHEGWVSAKGIWVAAAHYENATYTLLERPEPPKPNPFAEAKVGSIATYGEEGVKYLKTGENAWAPISRKGTLSGYRNSDESMTNCGDLIQVTHNA